MYTQSHDCINIYIYIYKTFKKLKKGIPQSTRMTFADTSSQRGKKTTATLYQYYQVRQVARIPATVVTECKRGKLSKEMQIKTPSDNII